MFRMGADKLILDLMAERIDLYVNVSVCHQLTMLIIFLFSESVFEEKNRRKHIYLPDLIMH